MRFKTLKESSKRTISASGGLGLLQILSEPCTRRGASEEAEPRRGWTQGGMPARTLSPKREWTRDGVPTRTLSPKGGGLGRSHINWRGNECQRGRWVPKGDRL